MGLFLDGYNCTQSISYAFRDELNLPEGTALKISCGLGAGMARQGEVCGAVTGGILRHGRGLDDDRTATETTYARPRELMDRFASKHGSCLCRQLLNGCDPSTQEGRNFFKEHDYLNRICLNCGQSVVEFLDQIDKNSLDVENGIVSTILKKESRL